LITITTSNDLTTIVTTTISSFGESNRSTVSYIQQHCQSSQEYYEQRRWHAYKLYKSRNTNVRVNLLLCQCMEQLTRYCRFFLFLLLLRDLLELLILVV